MKEAKVKQEIIDKILDKISKSGCDSLSKKEKDILFEQSQEMIFKNSKRKIPIWLRNHIFNSVNWTWLVLFESFRST